MRLHASTRTGRGLRGNTRPGANATSIKRTLADRRMETALRVAQQAAAETKALREQGNGEPLWYEDVLNAGPQYGLVPRHWSPNGLVYDTPRRTGCCAGTHGMWLTQVENYRRRAAKS